MAARPEKTNWRDMPPGDERHEAAVEELRDGLDAGDPVALQMLADGPIMDANTIFLPCGRLSWAQYRERQRECLS